MSRRRTNCIVSIVLNFRAHELDNPDFVDPDFWAARPGESHRHPNAIRVG